MPVFAVPAAPKSEGSSESTDFNKKFLQQCYNAFLPVVNYDLLFIYGTKESTPQNARKVKKYLISTDFKVQYTVDFKGTTDSSDSKYATVLVKGAKKESNCNAYNMNKYYGIYMKKAGVSTFALSEQIFKNPGDVQGMHPDVFISRLAKVLDSMPKLDPSKEDPTVPAEFTKTEDPSQSGSSTENPDGQSDGTEEDPCTAGFMGFGWLMCPGSSILESIINGLLHWIEDSMTWSFFTSKTGSADIKKKWDEFLPIANIAFALVFLFLIYSMATSTGLSNYNIKQILPKVIVAAVAVNISFYICAAAVDVSNILGKGIYTILSGSQDTWQIQQNSFTNDVANMVIVVGAFVTFGGTALVALAIIVLAVTLRQVALAVLVILSPLAFVCIMLPNTKQYFDKWKGYFIKLLMVYPIFMTVWGGSRMISELFGDHDGATPLTGSQANVSTMPPFMIDIICMIAPALAIVPIFKSSAAAFDKFGAMGKLGAAKSRIAGGIDAKSRAIGRAGKSLATNNAAARKSKAFAGNMAGRALNKMQGAPLVGGMAARGALKSQAYANTNTNSLHNRAMEMAEANMSQKSQSELVSIAKGEGNANVYEQAAALKAVGGSMSPDDLKQAVMNSHTRIQQMGVGRSGEAKVLSQAAVGALQSSNLPSNFTNTAEKLGAQGVDASEFSGIFNNDVANGLGNMSAEQQTSTYTPQNKAFYDNAINNASDSARQLANDRIIANAGIINNAVTSEPSSRFALGLTHESKAMNKEIANHKSRDIDLTGGGGKHVA